MMLSMILPFGIATSKVIWQDGGGIEIFQRNGKRHRIARTIFNRAKKFISHAVQNRDRLAVFHAQNFQRMMRLAPVEPERISGAIFWRQIKAVH